MLRNINSKTMEIQVALLHKHQTSHSEKVGGYDIVNANVIL